MARTDNRPSLADALYPSLSASAKAKEAQQARAAQEQQERSKRLAADIRAMREAMRADKQRGSR